MEHVAHKRAHREEFTLQNGKIAEMERWNEPAMSHNFIEIGYVSFVQV